MKKFMFIPLLCMICFASCSSSKSSASSDSYDPNVVAGILNKDYTVTIYEADPMSMRNIQVGLGYYLRISGNTVDCNLPYYGQVYTPAAAQFGSGSERLFFRKPVEDYIMTKGKNGMMNVNFKVYVDQDQYKFQLQIYPDGTSTINVNAFNRQPIVYYGNMD